MQQNLITLAKLKKGHSGTIKKIDESLLPYTIDLEKGELERRLLEIGIIEGTKVCVLHFGLINRDPIAVQIGDSDTIVAIRKNEAAIIMLSQLDV